MSKLNVAFVLSTKFRAALLCTLELEPLVLQTSSGSHTTPQHTRTVCISAQSLQNHLSHLCLDNPSMLPLPSTGLSYVSSSK